MKFMNLTENQLKKMIKEELDFLKESGDEEGEAAGANGAKVADTTGLGSQSQAQRAGVAMDKIPGLADKLGQLTTYGQFAGFLLTNIIPEIKGIGAIDVLKALAIVHKKVKAKAK